MKNLHPTGDGDPNCPLCEGRGVVDYKPEGAVIPGVKTCSCKAQQLASENLQEIWAGLKTVDSVESTPLSEYQRKNLYLTVPLGLLKKHLKCLVAQQEGPWFCRVLNEVQLVDSWLARIEKKDLLDRDVKNSRRDEISGRYATLADATVPPELLIVLLGVKVTPNKETPTVVLESLYNRDMEGKPTWLVDSPATPFQPGHLAYSGATAEFIAEWPHLVLGTEEKRPAFVSGEIGLTTDISGTVTAQNGGFKVRR